MGKIYFWTALGATSVASVIGVIVAKAQSDPQLWYAWVLKAAWVVPSLSLFAALCFFMAIREWKHFRRYCWLLFAWVVPPHVASVSDKKSSVSGQPSMPTPALDKVPPNTLWSPIELRGGLSRLAGDLITILIEHEYEIEPSDNGEDGQSAGLQEKPVDETIRRDFARHDYRERLSIIRSQLAYNELLNAQVGNPNLTIQGLPVSSPCPTVRTVIDMQIKNADDLRELISCLREVIGFIDHKFGLLPIGKYPLDLYAREKERLFDKEKIARLEGAVATGKVIMNKWPDVWHILAAAEEMDRLKRFLSGSLGYLRSELGKEQFYEMLSTPLSSVQINSAEYWKLSKKQFQDDVRRLNDTDLPFGAFFVKSTIPSDIPSDALIERLEKNHKELTAHAARLLAPPTASAASS
jgi:hypothetical protein